MATLKELRNSAGITQCDLAQAIGVSQGHMSHIENGIKTPPLSKLKVMANLLGVTLDQLAEVLEK